VSEPQALPDQPASRGALATPAQPWLRETAHVLTYATLFAAAVLLAILGAFHIPNRPSFLGAHWPVAVLLAAGGNLCLGLLAGWGLQGRSGPAVVFGGWILGVGLVMFGGSDDVVIGGTPGDWVPLGFLVAGAVAGVLAVAVSVRFVDPASRARLTSSSAGPDPKSSLRASGRR
jgi:hypothetical protein